MAPTPKKLPRMSKQTSRAIRKFIKQTIKEKGGISHGDQTKLAPWIAGRLAEMKLTYLDGSTIPAVTVRKFISRVAPVRGRARRRLTSTATTGPMRTKCGMPETLRVILTDESLNSKQRLALVETWFAA
jgi:hypothetical protein